MCGCHLALSPCGRGCVGGLRPLSYGTKTPMLCIGHGEAKAGEGLNQKGEAPPPPVSHFVRNQPLPRGERGRKASKPASISSPRSPQLQRGEAGQRQHHRDDPEPDHDLRFGPAKLLEMVMDRRHPENAFAGELERHHLHDHGNRFQHEQPATPPEPAPTTNTPPTPASPISCLPAPAIERRMPPSASEPVSPMKID